MKECSFVSIRLSAALSAALVAFYAGAMDLSGLVDVKFAESYAFSTNRAALIETLPPKTDAWYIYSILNAEVEGRLDEAKALNNKWHGDGSNRRLAFAMRNNFLLWDVGKCQDFFIPQHLGYLKIWNGLPEREVDLKPNTHPAELDQADVSYEAFRGKGNRYWGDLEPNYRLLCFKDPAFAEKLRPHDIRFAEAVLPDTPGLFEAVVAYLKDGDKNDRFFNQTPFKDLTLAQLFSVAKETKGREKDVSASTAFADVVLAKLTEGADADLSDMKVREDQLKRRLAFADTLAPALNDRKVRALKELLDFYREAGDFSHKDLFIRYLREVKPERSVVHGDDFINDWLAALRRAGSDMAEFAGIVEKEFLARTVAESDLVAGRPAAEIEVGALSSEQFKKIQDRVELNWAKTNPRLFASSDDVSLMIDVKNVPKMRIAVYELDAAAACREAKGEVASDIDLDCAVPTHERTIDYSAPSVLRHRETLAFPELKDPGLYVVECSGQGVASRALVRKGRIRATERRESSGHVFTALGEDGRAVKGATLWLDGTAFKADENGEIPVPFASTEKDAGRKTAIVGAGRLACAVSFDHAAESYSLEMGVVLPPEELVAGREATALIRPTLFTGGMPSPLKILEKPVLTVVFRDIKGRVSAKTFKDFALFDDAESVCRFVVPKNLSRIEFTLEGEVKRMTGESSETLSAHWGRSANRIASDVRVEQLFLRRTSGGYVLECRGRTGERIASRAVELKFKHRVFQSHISIAKTLQFDEEGVIRLGRLADVERVSTDAFGGYTWNLGERVRLPPSLTVAEGEAIEIPVRGLFDGAWPGAREFNNRISLLAVNKAGAYTVDCVDACSYSNGVLRIEALIAGDYRLRLRTEGTPATTISVVRSMGGVGDGGVVSGRARAVTDIGSPSRLRIEGAEVSTNCVLDVRLANSSANARVHVFASRTMGDGREGASPRAALSAAVARAMPAVRTWRWGDASSSYISGRDLGDKLRYILDRRQEPGRIGNMLQRPSLILNPWTTSETDTKEIRLSDGNGWDEAPPPECAAAESLARSGGFGGDSILASPFVCRDFLPAPAAVFANLKPDREGRVSVDVSKAAGMQDLVVVVTDGLAVDCVELAGEAAPFAPRDLRLAKGMDPLAGSARTKSYSTVGELHALLKSLRADVGTFAEFGFLSDWHKKDDGEKRTLYGKYACHELDFFLYEKDRAFFDSVVAPNLVNKRLKDFMDKWLLGEDVSEYAAPGRLQDLNALEACLLARRVKSVAPAVAREFADWCSANPADPDEEDMALAIALDDMEAVHMCEMQSAPAAAELKTESSAWRPVGGVAPGSDLGMDRKSRMEALRAEKDRVRREMVEDVEAGWSSQRYRASEDSMSFASSPVKMKSMASSRSPGSIGASARRANEVNRRKERQFWRPPERTKEWVESYWYKLRRSEDTEGLVPVNRFWRDYARAVLFGEEGAFRSANIIDADSTTFSQMLAALAVTRVGFEAKEGEAVTFSRGAVAESADGRQTLKLERHFFETGEANEDGSAKEVTEEFVRGRVYRMETIAINPTAVRRRVRVVSQIPEGAFPVGGCGEAYDGSIDLDAYETTPLPSQEFYFPFAEEGVGRAAPAVAVERGARVGEGDVFLCNVVAESSKRDTTSWRYVSQKATKGEVLEYLKTKNLANVDLEKIGWRFIDGDFARKALAVLESRGVYCQGLWLAGFKWKDAFDARRVREALSRRENRLKLAPMFGPVFKSSLVEIEPEESGLFEHREYWPIINARTHAKGGAATIANEALAKEYREFLDVLAAKKAPSARDRLLAAVYLVAQDRIPEAEAQVAAAEASKEAAAIETRMQLDYLKAYLAFSRGDAAGARAFASKWADAPTPLWRGRFREVLAQADEVAGKGEAAAADGEASAAAPSLAVRADMKGGVAEGIVLTARNLAKCTVKAYPVDVEICFSKNPFGSASSSFGGVLGLRPAWSEDVALEDGGETRVAVPKPLRGANLVLVASGADGRAEERLEITPGSFDVQVAREARQLRVRRADGRPLVGAYVKVYARDALGREVKFHKDGYTDLRGAFDYESVSTDTEFRPAEFAVLVQGSEGVRTLRVQAR